MAVSEFELFKINRYCDQRVPTRARDQVRVESSVRGNTVTIVECRAPWHESLTEWTKHEVARLRVNVSTGKWSLFWRDRNNKWNPYDLVDAGTLDEMLAAIDEDVTCIFWG